MTCLRFPALPHRAWRVSESPHAPDEYVGELIPADGWTGPTRTASGPLGLVIEALLRPEVRNALPILIPAEGARIATRLISKMRPSRWRPTARTDRDKYPDALAAQRLADPSRWVPCDPWERDPAA